MPSLAVVTPVYNGERYLAECIESVLSQSFTDFEYIILDNASTDGTPGIAARYATDRRLRIVRNSTLIPLIANYNRGEALTSAQARYIKYVACDDLLLPDCLADMVAVAERYPEVLLVASHKRHGDAVITDGPPYPEAVVDGKTVCRWFFEGRLGVFGGPTNHLIRLPHPSMRGNLFDENFLHADIDYYVRLLKDGGAYGFVHKVLTFTREHQESVSSKFADVMGSRTVEFLAVLTRYGISFLSGDEHRSLLDSHRRAYARFLFRVLLKPWNRQIWNYQVASRRRFGIDVSGFDLVRAGVSELAASVISPTAAARRMHREYTRLGTARRMRNPRSSRPTG